MAPVAALLASCESSPPTGTPTPGRTASPSASTSTASRPAETPTASAVRRTPGAPCTLTTGIEVPWNVVFLPDGDALVSSRDTGRIVHVTRAGRKRVVATVPGVVSNVDQGGEAGLLGLALHPRFATEPWLYVYHSTRSDNRVVRMRYRDGRLGRPRLVLDGIRTAVHHNGGGLAFGPDGHLFVSTGDAESSASAQDTTSLNGKILRVTDTGRTPRGNPFGNPEIGRAHV